jgi:hypothetical protein
VASSGDVILQTIIGLVKERNELMSTVEWPTQQYQVCNAVYGLLIEISSSIPLKGTL